MLENVLDFMTNRLLIQSPAPSDDKSLLNFENICMWTKHVCLLECAHKGCYVSYNSYNSYKHGLFTTIIMFESCASVGGGDNCPLIWIVAPFYPF